MIVVLKLKNNYQLLLEPKKMPRTKIVSMKEAHYGWYSVVDPKLKIMGDVHQRVKVNHYKNSASYICKMNNQKTFTAPN